MPLISSVSDFSSITFSVLYDSLVDHLLSLKYDVVERRRNK